MTKRPWHYSTFSKAGTKFGEWTTLGPSRYTKRTNGSIREQYFCRCSCGKEDWVFSSNMRRGLSSRCDKCRLKFLADRVEDRRSWFVGSITNGRIIKSYDEKTRKYTIVCQTCEKVAKRFISSPGDFFHIGKCNCSRLDIPKKKKYGPIIWNGQDMTLALISEMLDISKQRVSQIAQEQGVEEVIRRLNSTMETVQQP